MNEEQLRAAITQAISDNQIDVVNELTPLLQRAEQEGADAAQRAAGATFLTVLWVHHSLTQGLP